MNMRLSILRMFSLENGFKECEIRQGNSFDFSKMIWIVISWAFNKTAAVIWGQFETSASDLVFALLCTTVLMYVIFRPEPFRLFVEQPCNGSFSALARGWLHVLEYALVIQNRELHCCHASPTKSFADVTTIFLCSVKKIFKQKGTRCQNTATNHLLISKRQRQGVGNLVQAPLRQDRELGDDCQCERRKDLSK